MNKIEETPITSGEHNQLNSTVASEPKTMLTQEEFDEKVAKHLKTPLGQIMPIILQEIPRVAVILASNFLISFTYAFLRQFKSVITQRSMNPQASNWLKIGVFMFSVYSISFSNAAFAELGAYKGTQKYIICAIAIYTVVSVLIFFQNYFWFNPGWAELIITGGSMSVRTLNFFKTPLVIFNHLFLSLYYTVSEVIASTMMTTIFSAFLLTYIGQKEYKRYLRPIIIAANISLLTSTTLIKLIVGKFKQISTKNFKWVYIAVFTVASANYLVLFGMTYFMNYMFQHPLYIKSSTGAASGSSKPKKKAPSLGLFQMITMLKESKLLSSICAMGFGYNFSTTIHSLTAEVSYAAFFQYLKAFPDLNQKASTASREAIAQSYKSNENTILALSVIGLMLVPVVPQLFERLGMLVVGFFTPLVCLVSAFTCLFWASVNYLNKAGSHAPIMFGIKNYFNLSVNFERECFSLSLLSCLIKIAKYAVHDYVTENIFFRIFPDKRFVIKGISSAICGKGAKMIASVMSLFLEAIGLSDNARYFSPLSFIIIAILVILWAFGLFYLGRAYKKANDDDTYIVDSPLFGAKAVKTLAK